MEKKPNLQTQLKFSIAFVWVGALLAILSNMAGDWLLWVGIGIACLAIVYRYCMIRCPYCKHPLGYDKTIPSECPNCHKELD